MIKNASGPRKATNATGTLTQTPFAHCLVYLRNKRLTGVFELKEPGGRDARLELWRGMITHATTTPAVARFGSVVYELGWIDATTLDASGVPSMKRQTPQADLLVETGAITSKQRDDAQAEQVRRRVHHAFTFSPESRFFFTEAKPAKDEPRLIVDPLGPAWRGILDFPPRDDVRHVLAKIGDVPLRMVSESLLERAGLTGEEKRLCELLAAGAMTAGSLRAAARVPFERVDLLVYLLVIAKCVESDAPHASGTMLVASTRASAPDDDAEPPRKRSFELSATNIPAAQAARAASERPIAAPIGPMDLGIDGIKKRAASLAFESAYEALGLPEGASVEAARAAYVRLAKLWHPDKLPADLAPLYTDVARIYLHVIDSFRAIAAAAQEARAAT